MKTILCDRERPAEIGDQVRDGDFSYRLEFGWAKLARRNLEGSIP